MNIEVMEGITPADICSDALHELVRYLLPFSKTILLIEVKNVLMHNKVTISAIFLIKGDILQVSDYCYFNVPQVIN